MFVGTLGTLFGIEGGEERIADVASQIDHSGVTHAALAGLMMILRGSTTVRINTCGYSERNWQRPACLFLLFVGYGLLAYAIAFVTKSLLSVF